MAIWPHKRWGVSKVFTHDYGGGGGGWPYDDIGKNNFFSQNEIALKQKRINN